MNLSFEQISGVVGIARGARTDRGAGVPPGTLAALVGLGYAKKTSQDSYAVTPAARRKFAEWLASRVAPVRPAPPPVVASSPRGEGKPPAREGKLATGAAITARGTNPKRAGTQAHEFYALAQRSPTVGEYREAGGDMRYLLQFLYAGLVKIS